MPDLGPNCLQRLSDDTSGHQQMTLVGIRNEFCFSDVHESLSVLSSVQSKLHQYGIMSILKHQSKQIPSVLLSAEML